MTFDPLHGPNTLVQGADGTVMIGNLTVGRLTSWRVVMSPTTGMPTLMGEGRFKRYYVQGVGGRATAHLTPAKRAYRIGRPRPKPPEPFALTGKLYELTAGKITISEGEIEARD